MRERRGRRRSVLSLMAEAARGRPQREAGWVSVAFHSGCGCAAESEQRELPRETGATESTVGKPDSPSGIHP